VAREAEAMKSRIYTDDLPDFILAGFIDVKQETGRYPRTLLVNHLLGEMMGARPGVWRLYTPGVWGWSSWLDPEVALRMDEFGRPEN
jgi:hypothetical protein